MRPTDFCHLYELRVPVPRAFPARSRSFRRVGAPRSLWLRAALPGEGVFHDTLDRFGGSLPNTTGFFDPAPFIVVTSRWRLHSGVGVVFPRRLECSIVPLTSLSLLPLPKSPGSPSRSLRLGAVAPSLALREGAAETAVTTCS
jgi:hypothetical protein